MDSLTWLRQYNPLADETLRAEGDTRPLITHLRQAADELSTTLGKLDLLETRERNGMAQVAQLEDDLKDAIDKRIELQGRLDQLRSDADAYIAKLGEEHQARIAAERRLDSVRSLYCLLYSPDGGLEEYRSVVFQCRAMIENNFPDLLEVIEMKSRVVEKQQLISEEDRIAGRHAYLMDDVERPAPIDTTRGPCPLCGRTDNHSHTAGPFGMS